MNRTLVLLVASTLLLGAFVARAHDDDDEDERPRGKKQNVAAAALRTTPEWKAYETECGSCHLAFPPNLLPAPSWKSVMGGLTDHFGQNA
ncbi:MAG: CxxxxCH/CxxCH domain-containing protein, partial [Myxococcales bacterium]|nr:CxxxxCH/CxxCH domain-containing protein [Myxococcales bacterium]